MDFLYFLGRFHVLALHLPIGIIYVAVALDFLARRPRYAGLGTASTFLWGAAALTAIVTVTFGLFHAMEGGFTGESFERHRALGISIAVLATALWLFRLRAPVAYLRTQPVTAVIALLLVAITGHYGGNMTHGATYLTEYAPAPLKRLAGLEVREAVTSAGEADVFADVVHPMLEQRCGSCHGQDTRKGDLSFATYELTLAGGEQFAAVVPGDLNGSEMIARVTMDPSSPDYMPKEGKTPLTAEQIRIISWWIEAGAPQAATVASLNPPADVLGLIEAELNL